MRTTPDMFELSPDEIDQVSGGKTGTGCTAFGSCYTGNIQFGNGPNGSFVQWQGQLGGTDGIYTITSKGGLTWFPGHF